MRLPCLYIFLLLMAIAPTMLRAQMEMPAGMQMQPAASPAALPATLPTTRTTVVLSVTTEEGQKMLEAAVTLDGKPVEDATVEFLVKRTFGAIAIGQDKTLDDGTAAVKFPADLPGNAAGMLHVLAEVRLPALHAGARTEADLPGGLAMPLAVQEYPRRSGPRRRPGC